MLSRGPLTMSPNCADKFTVLNLNSDLLSINCHPILPLRISAAYAGGLPPSIPTRVSVTHLRNCFILYVAFPGSSALSTANHCLFADILCPLLARYAMKHGYSPPERGRWYLDVSLERGVGSAAKTGHLCEVAAQSCSEPQIRFQTKGLGIRRTRQKGQPIQLCSDDRQQDESM